MMTQTCSTCRFWRLNVTSDAVGSCRRSPPRLMSEPERGKVGEDHIEALWQATRYPVTSEDGWCGKWEISASESASHAATREADIAERDLDRRYAAALAPDPFEPDRRADRLKVDPFAAVRLPEAPPWNTA